MGKHNKKRNVAVVYEALIVELTKGRVIAEGDEKREKIILDLLKRYYGKGTQIRMEYRSARDLSTNEDGLSREEFSEVISEHRRNLEAKIDRVKLKREKDALISEINRKLGSDVFDNFLPNYRALASIGQLLDEGTSPKARVKLAKKLFDSVTPSVPVDDELRPLDELELKVFCESFNKEYEEFLPEQKKLLSKFAGSVSSDSEYLFYLNEEFGRLFSAARAYRGEHEEDIAEVISVLESVSKEPRSDKCAETVLRVQKLIKELEVA